MDKLRSFLIILSLFSSSLGPLPDQHIKTVKEDLISNAIILPHQEEDGMEDGEVIEIEKEEGSSLDETVIEETAEEEDAAIDGSFEEDVMIEEKAEEGSSDVQDESLILQTFVFIEESAADGIGSLPEEILDLLPEDSHVLLDEEIVLPELDAYEMSGYSFSGWELYTELLTGTRTFQGVWRKDEPRRLLRSSGTKAAAELYSGFGATWTYQRPGYIGTHAFTLGGQPAYCIDPSRKVPAAGTLYTYNAKITSRVAEIIGMGELNGISQGAIQATLDRYAGYNASSTSSEPTDPNDPVYNASGYSCSLDAYDPSDPNAQRFGIGAKCEKGSPPPEDGWIRVNKSAADKGIDYLALHPDKYSLENAIYGYYYDKECTQLVFEAATKPNGQTSRNRVSQGTYYIKEIKASKGFKLDPKVYEVTVSAAFVYEVYSIEEPEEMDGKMKMLKKASVFEGIDYLKNTSSYSLAGAEYTVYKDKDLKETAGKLVTGKDGSSNELTLSEGTYYVKETKASKGFDLDPKTYTVTVSANKTSTFTSFEDPKTVKVKVKKSEGLAGYEFAKLFPNSYSLSGARYGIYSDAKATSMIGEFKTGSGGDTTAIELPFGTYYIKEIDASKGFMLDEDIHKISLEEDGKTYTVSSREMPYTGIFDLILIKENARDKNDTEYLEDARFTLKYYDTDKEDLNGLQAKYSWVFSPILNSKKEAEVLFDSRHLVSGDALLLDGNGDFFLPLGRFTLEETHAPKTFTRDENIYHGSVDFASDSRASSPSVRIDGRGLLMISGKQIRQEEQKQAVKITVIKTDSETKTNRPQGVASLKGAEFEISYLNNDGSKTFVGKISTGEDGKASIDKDKEGKSLLPGTYCIKETKAPPGYILNDKEHQIEALIKDEQTAVFEYEISIENDITGIIVHKVDSDGEYVNDEQTQLQIIDEEGNIVYSWISDGLPRIIKGLATDGRYRLHESASNPAYRMAEDKELFVSAFEMRNYTLVNSRIRIGTSAAFADGTKVHDADGSAQIIDEVTYENLYEGRDYLLKAQLIDKADGSIIMETERPFVPERRHGKERVVFDLALDGYDGRDFVVYETLYLLINEKETEVARHADISDEGQTVHIDPIKRTDVIIRKTDEEGKQLDGAAFMITLRHLRSDGSIEETDLGKMSTKDGKIELKSVKTDTLIVLKEIAAPEGYYLDKEEKTFEIPKDCDKQVIEYAIINHKPQIRTSASFKESGNRNYYADGIAHIIDTVSYRYLDEGKEYLLKASLIDKKSGKAILDKEHRFVTEANEGKAEVEFKLELDDYPGSDLVVFEELYRLRDGKQELVAKHSDIDDKDQTVHAKGLYEATVILYKTDTDRTVKLNGAIFDVTSRRKKRDGTVIEEKLGRYITGGIYCEDDVQFTVELSRDENMKEIIAEYDSKIHDVLGLQHVSINGLDDGTYYIRKKGDERIKRYDVAKGAIILLDQKEDTKITFVELISPNGYQLSKEPFVIDVGHDHSLSLIENYRSNRRMIIPKTGD